MRRKPWSSVPLWGGCLILAGCAGPVPLNRAIRPHDEQAYRAALAGDPAHPADAFLAWRARQKSISLDEARRADAALSRTHNPFAANRDRNAVSLGAVIYKMHCLSCHGAQADGRGPMAGPDAKIRNFHSPATRFAVTLHGGAPRKWFRAIHDGAGTPPPTASGHATPMPAFGQTLSNEQIWLVITYLQSLDMYAGAAHETATPEP